MKEKRILRGVDSSSLLKADPAGGSLLNAAVVRPSSLHHTAARAYAGNVTQDRCPHSDWGKSGDLQRTYVAGPLVNFCVSEEIHTEDRMNELLIMAGAGGG